MAAIFFYVLGSGICPTPFQYRIGVLDERFGLSQEAALTAIANAEAIWEDYADRDLFVYDPEADFPINFVFDERQALTDAEGNFRERLDRAEGVNEGIEAQYEALVSEYDDLRTEYDTESAAYDVALSAYNDVVAAVNAAGGASPEQFDELAAEQSALNARQQTLNGMVDRLNMLVDEINQIGDEGNRLIDTYNRGVEVYNNTFGDEREFTQGDYQGTEINIYTFKDQAELELVLAHELGHALSLDHVSGSNSVMFYLIGQQPEDLVLSEYDVAEFNRVCSPRSVWDTVKDGFAIVSNTHTHPHN